MTLSNCHGCTADADAAAAAVKREDASIELPGATEAETSEVLRPVLDACVMKLETRDTLPLLETTVSTAACANTGVLHAISATIVNVEP